MKNIGNIAKVLTQIIKYGGVIIALVQSVQFFQEKLKEQGLITNSEENAKLSE